MPEQDRVVAAVVGVGGSASQVIALASSLFNGALAVLAAAEHRDGVRQMAAWVVRLEADLGAPTRPPVRLGWRNAPTATPSG
jgi:hypothetical protein